MAKRLFTLLRKRSDLATWKPWLILIVTLVSILCSLMFALQGRTFDGAARQGEQLYLTNRHNAPVVVLALRRPDQTLPFRLRPDDVVAQIDGLETYAALDAYTARQKTLMTILEGPTVMVTVASPGHPPIEIARQVTTLNLSGFNYSFWVSLFVGVLAFIIGGWVWALKPHEDVTKILAANSFGILLAAVSSCGIYAQPIAMSPSIISFSIALNHLATVIFGLTLVGLFLQFPQRLISQKQFWLCMATGVPVFLLDQLRLLGGPSGIIIFCFIVIGLVVALIAVQFYRSRQEAGARASLMWLGLAVVAGGGSWGVIVLAYLVQGQLHNMPESFTFISFLVLYGGIALGVARFRLFEVGDWAFRIFFFTVAAALFMGLDAGLVYLAGLAKPSALALSLLLIAFGYLPVRDRLWRRFMHPPRLGESERLSSALDMAFATQPGQRQILWRGLLQNLFTPVSMDALPADVAAARIEAEGLHLCVPALNDIPPLRLSYPQDGRGLFSPRDIALVNQIVRLSREASAGLQAYERGAAEQRQRLAQDLHDDVGAKLVSGLTVADDRVRPYIYGALNDIREIASALVTESAPLDRVLADIRHETVRRLDVAGLELDWPLWPEDAPYVLLSALQKKALTSIIRELISNIIKHAQARQVSVCLMASSTQFTGRIEDDGAGFPAAVTDGLWNGLGLRNISERMAQLGGDVQFRNQTAGAMAVFGFPLQTALLDTQGENHAL